jgi:hypothetical protein
MIFLPRQNTVAVCKQITLLNLFYVSSRPVTLLKITDATVPVSDIFDLTVSFKFINCSFHTFLLFVPAMSTGFTSSSVKIIYIALVSILYPLHFTLLSLI